MAPAAPEKLDQDVLTTRGHWYPKWILFTASTNKNNLLLANREAIGQAVCDFAIMTGNAIPVPRDKQAVADAMPYIKLYHCEMVFKFHYLLATQAQDQGGWYIFLEAAAKTYALMDSSGDIALERLAVQLWSSWYSEYLWPHEITSFDSPWVFLDVLGATKEFVHFCIVLAHSI